MSMSEEQVQAQATAVVTANGAMTKIEKIELKNKKRAEKKAEREAKKAAKREELERTTVEIPLDEFHKFKEWKRSQAKVRVSKKEYEAFLVSTKQHE
jgi:hypothetical protein